MECCVLLNKILKKSILNSLSRLLRRGQQVQDPPGHGEPPRSGLPTSEAGDVWPG
jgi:hypothetical protein